MAKAKKSDRKKSSAATSSKQKPAAASSPMVDTGLAAKMLFANRKRDNAPAAKSGGSGLIDQLSEYNVGQYKITHGRRTGSATITIGAPRSSVTDAAIQTFLQQKIAKGAVPKVTANTLYVIYVPPGVRVVMGGSASCQSFCGYHSAIGGKTFYAVMPYPGCNGCTGSLAVFDALTSTSSHELCEAITDPVPGQGWYDDAHGEIGDICAWHTKKAGPYTVQLEWSNKAGQCV